MNKEHHFLFTCEHAYPNVPQSMSQSVTIPKGILNSHKSYDPGALDTAKFLAHQLQGKYFDFPWSRLAIDANRNLKSKNIFSPWSRQLDLKKKNSLIKDYLRYRNEVTQTVEKLIKNKENKICVISCHSFTPIFNGKNRKTDLGILFRPGNKKEIHLAQHLKKSFQQTNFAVHFNLPYRGHTDCFLNDILDNHLKSPQVTGCFLEINQRILKSKALIIQLHKVLADGLETFYF